MGQVELQNFGGMCPAVNSRTLPPNAAVDVVNVRIHEGEITPLQQLSEQFTFPGVPGSIRNAVRIPDPLNTAGNGYTWLGLTSMNASFSRPAINEDEFERYVYSNGDYLTPVMARYNTLANIRNGIADYQLGVVQPTFTPVVNVSGGAVPGASSATVYTTGSLPGTGYAVGDTITLAGGTFTEAAVVQVDQVNNATQGQIVSVVVLTPGSYVTIPPTGPVYQASTSGSGSGAAFTLVFGSQGGEDVGVVNAGSNYAPGDTITLPGGTYTQQCVVEVGTIVNEDIGATSGPIATAYVSTPGEYTALPTNPLAQESTSGLGTGATFDLTFSGQALQSATVYNTGSVGGTGYAVNDQITIAGGTLTSAATPAILFVTSVGLNGVVTGVYVGNPGAYTALPGAPAQGASYSQPITQESTTGVGTGAQFQVVWVIEGAAVAIPVAAGSGYVVGDQLTVVGGNFTEQAVLTVATLAGSAIATVTINNPGTYIEYPTSPVAVTGGTGTGVTFNIAWGNENPTETRAYVCTYVDIFGQESAPSNGGLGTGEVDGTWSITGYSFPLINPGAPIAAINLYRTITTSATSATYYLVASIPFDGVESGVPANPGSGYAAGDTILVAGGTYTEQCELVVTEITQAGGIVDFDIVQTGLYSVIPNNPLAQDSTSGNGSGATFTLAFFANNQQAYLDTIDDETLSLEAVTLLTTGWLPPVAMEGFVACPGGFLCGWAGNQIYMSVPGAPWAWPIEYQMSVDAQIVGMGYLDGSIVVFTNSSPWQLTGTVPSAITSSKVSTIAPCTSRGSIAQAIDGIDYASRNGIINSSPYGFVNVSDKIISTEEWRQQLFGNIIAGVRYEDTYIGLVGTGTGFIMALQGYEGGYFLNPQNVRIAASRFLLAQQIINMVIDPFSSVVFMIDNNNTVFLWDDPSAGQMVGRWKSKEFASVQSVNFGAFVCALDVPSYGPQNTDELAALQSTQGDPAVPDPLTTAEQLAVTAETTLIGYTSIGNAMIGGGIAQGAVPPGMTGDVNAPVYPFYPGLIIPQPNQGQGGAGAGGSADPDWTLMPSLPYGYSAGVDIYANRQLVYSGPINSNVMTRLPSGFKSNLWQIAITTAVPVWSFAMGTTAKELKLAK